MQRSPDSARGQGAKPHAGRHAAVCMGKITLAAAQKAIGTNWTTALQKLGVS
ncbi:hypothetical protein SRB17_78390 [Streptomyces sp. RB17]|uniref:hypothetical protein n=1 Tax=Streptomyces sp. RB17 TaxID=2585197 RepID=UPI00129638F6|nr:hypothetical protein [Streptomyces sp. RB17]MQY39811.1 hypothetical protein [Streptomyces sp. RB17]